MKLIFELKKKYVQDAMDKSSPFLSINLAHAPYLFQVLPTVQQTSASWALSFKN